MNATAELTKNQTAVFKALSAAETPLTAYELLDRDEVRGEGVKAPLSVYRALEKLLEFGLVHRIESLNAYLPCCASKRHTEPVAFVICSECRRASELQLKDCRKHLTATAEAAGYDVETVRVEMVGRCPACAAAKVMA